MDVVAQPESGCRHRHQFPGVQQFTLDNEAGRPSCADDVDRADHGRHRGAARVWRMPRSRHQRSDLQSENGN
jgi:hypothetical protein